MNFLKRVLLIVLATAGLHAGPWSLLTWTVPIQNDGTTGTTVAHLASKSSAGNAILSTAGGTNGVIGVVKDNAGINGNAIVAYAGPVQLAADGTVAAGHYITLSSSVNGDGQDAGATCPTSGQVLGFWTESRTGAGTYWAFLNSAVCPPSASSVAFNSVTTGTNANVLHVGTGGTLDATGTGTISANLYKGATIPRGPFATFDGGGSALTAGRIYYLPPITYGGTISGWNICLDQGTATVDMARVAGGTSIPVFPTNSITGFSGSTPGAQTPAIVTGTCLPSTALGSWTSTTIAVKDALAFKLTAVGGSATQVSISVEVDQ